MRPIDADRFECVALRDCSNEFAKGAEYILEMIDAAPTLELEPVAYAHWEDATCSRCGHNLSEISDADSYFCIGFNENDYVACPFCGAKMIRRSGIDDNK